MKKKRDIQTNQYKDANQQTEHPDINNINLSVEDYEEVSVTDSIWNNDLIDDQAGFSLSINQLCLQEKLLHISWHKLDLLHYVLRQPNF